MQHYEAMVNGKKVRPFRLGKTAKDRERGAAKANAENKRARREWQQEFNPKAANNPTFPSHTCNGKKNRQYTNS